MYNVLPIETVGIAENGGGFLKRDAMLFEIRNRLRNIPGKHIYVYT